MLQAIIIISRKIAFPVPVPPKFATIGAIVLLSLATTPSVQGALYPPKYQPELEQLSLEKYTTNDYLFQMHVNCLFYDGPCDPVGRWMVPRMASYFLNSCILCTPNQEKESAQFIDYLAANHPQLFQLGIKKYLDANGITLPANSKYREQVQKMNVPEVSISSEEEDDEREEMKPQRVQPKIQTTTTTPKTHQPHQQQPQPQPLEQQESQQQQQQQEEKRSNSRKHKFSSAMEGNGNGNAEDDEAEMEFRFYH